MLSNFNLHQSKWCAFVSLMVLGTMAEAVVLECNVPSKEGTIAIHFVQEITQANGWTITNDFYSKAPEDVEDGLDSWVDQSWTISRHSGRIEVRATRKTLLRETKYVNTGKCVLVGKPKL